MSLRLLRPTLRYRSGFISALRELKEESQHPRSLEDQAIYLADYVKRWRLLSRGSLKGVVPQTVYWLLDGPTYIGMVQIRHRPSGRHSSIKSHLYYEIRPSKRRRGYGTALVRLALQKAKRLGMREFLVTCDFENTASRKIIEQAGGVLEKEIQLPGESARVRRYRIRLKQPVTRSQ